MHQKASKSVREQKTVAVLITRNQKSGRDRLSGIMRCLAKRPDVRLLALGTNDVPNDTQLHVHGVIIGDAALKTAQRHISRTTKKVTLECPPMRKPVGKFNVSLDDQSIVQAAADLLLRRGYGHFAYVGTLYAPEYARSLHRGRTFADYIGRNACDCRVYDPEISSHTDISDSHDKLVQFISRLPLPCGIMVYADNRAQDVVDACHRLHLTIPDQVAIIGVDNEVDICENLRPTLSSVLPDFELCGYQAAEMLLNLIDGTPIRQPRLTYGVKAVIERESTQDLRCGGQLIARAEKYLKENFRQKFTVDTLARDLNVSRRLLELRFRDILGCSIHERIADLRLSEASRLLAHTNLSIEETAIQCGYGTVKAFRNAFIARFGQTPRDYRQSMGRPHLACSF